MTRTLFGFKNNPAKLETFKNPKVVQEGLSQSEVLL